MRKESKCQNYYRPQWSRGKVIFSQASVILFTGGFYPSMHCRWYPSMPCRFPGPHPRGKFRGIWSRSTAKGKLRGIWLGGGGCSGGMPGSGGCLVWGCLLQGVPGPEGFLLWGWSKGLLAGEGGDPPWRLLLKAVRILLECILVIILNFICREDMIRKFVPRWSVTCHKKESASRG